MTYKIAFLLMIAVAGTEKASDVENRIKSMIDRIAPAVDVIQIERSSIDNIMKVELSNGEIVYITKEAEFMFHGRLLQYANGKIKDLTERDLAFIRKAKLRNVDIENAITFEAENERKSEIFVFTDVSCAYCKKLHRHIDDINDLGITVHYLAFPRSGPESSVGDLMSDVWCSSDPRDALTRAKEERTITQSPKLCSSPVTEQYQLGLTLGITGTPGIYDINGRQLGGYLSPDELSKALEKK